METTFVIQNLVGTGVMISVAGVLVNRWMSTVDKRAEKLADDLKVTVREHRDELRALKTDLNDNLEGIYQQLRIANGRTAKLEGGLMVVEKVCAERHMK